MSEKLFAWPSMAVITTPVATMGDVAKLGVTLLVSADGNARYYAPGARIVYRAPGGAWNEDVDVGGEYARCVVSPPEGIEDAVRRVLAVE